MVDTTDNTAVGPDGDRRVLESESGTREKSAAMSHFDILLSCHHKYIAACICIMIDGSHEYTYTNHTNHHSVSSSSFFLSLHSINSFLLCLFAFSCTPKYSHCPEREWGLHGDISISISGCSSSSFFLFSGGLVLDCLDGVLWAFLDLLVSTVITCSVAFVLFWAVFFFPYIGRIRLYVVILLSTPPLSLQSRAFG
ncbi:hypothetical protein BZA05DRAFT_15271 [Tricharina praecox]|uniref:uncharacterized protein n=1 Tax=Tricharina praecox TaxID=43433 RepID=UPI00222055D2|nr:uncharacterized protein BZA05DRAFT_15271 [Tricharina praecox]KAI5858826.1 hypothetical protein BZA05DRAFT_15271 [Tricharina praecox]